MIYPDITGDNLGYIFEEHILVQAEKFNKFALSMQTNLNRFYSCDYIDSF